MIDIQFNGIAEEGKRRRSWNLLDQTHHASTSAIVDDDGQDQNRSQEDGDRRIVGRVLQGLREQDTLGEQIRYDFRRHCEEQTSRISEAMCSMVTGYTQ